jgi:hypothetical protein
MKDWTSSAGFLVLVAADQREGGPFVPHDEMNSADEDCFEEVLFERKAVGENATAVQDKKARQKERCIVIRLAL